MGDFMRVYLKISLLSVLLFFGVIGFINAKTGPAATLFTPQVAAQNNMQMIPNLNGPQLGAALQQFQQTSSAVLTPGFGGTSTASSGFPLIVHRASGNFNPGGTVVLDIDGFPFASFVLAFSLTGDYPGISFPSVYGNIVPLNPPYLATFFGFLGPTGQAQFILQLPNDPSLIGLPLTSAVGVIAPITLGNWILVSNPVSYTIGIGIVGNSCCAEGVLGGPDSQCSSGVSLNYCRLIMGGAVQDCIPPDTQQDPPPTSQVNLTMANINNNPAVDAVMRVVINSSISNFTYVNTTFDCDDFADTLEQYLWYFGFNSTYTIFVNYNGFGYSHAVTDVHLPDGSTFWIEPQTGQIISLDFNGDGHVDVLDRPVPYPRGYHPTDDNVKIVTYPSASFATAAGAPRD